MREDPGLSADSDYREAVFEAAEGHHGVPRPSGPVVLRRFRVIYRRALYLIALEVLLAFVAAVLLAFVPFSEFLLAYLLWASGFIAVAILYVVNWRCPACRGFLGGGFWGLFSVSHCLRCGVALK